MCWGGGFRQRKQRGKNKEGGRSSIGLQEHDVLGEEEQGLRGEGAACTSGGGAETVPVGGAGRGETGRGDPYNLDGRQQGPEPRRGVDDVPKVTLSTVRAGNSVEGVLDPGLGPLLPTTLGGLRARLGSISGSC